MNFERYGIETGYRDAQGFWQESARSTLETLRGMVERHGSKSDSHAPWLVRRGGTREVPGSAELLLEGESRGVRVEACLPRDLPLGYHRLRWDDSGAEVALIVTPERCYLPQGLRAWGWALQLYSLRSAESWGMGDFADLRRLARFSREELGARMLLLNPVHAPAPTLPQQPSPYYPSSRLYRNPLYLRVEEVPGWDSLGEECTRLAAAGRALNGAAQIERDRIFSLKKEALEKIFARFAGDPLFDAFIAEEGEALQAFATYCALAEEHGPNFRAWPQHLRDSAGDAVGEYRKRQTGRIRFHCFLQWQLDRQLQKAGKEIGLIADLAVGIDASGADAWASPKLFAEGMQVGAPPDELCTLGQSWGLLPIAPWELTSSSFQPFIRTVRGAMRHAAGIRLDHVMGLFRLFWIPVGGRAADGAYVRYPAAELLDLLALESVRAKAYVIGEDLGTVQQEVRQELAFRQVLSYRVMYFEAGDLSAIPTLSLATVTTHDLPTIAGVWTGSDVEEQRRLKLQPNEDSAAAMRTELHARVGLPHDAPLEEVILANHRLLGRSDAMLVCATLEDALRVESRPNVPGTIDEHANWRIPLPAALEEIEANDFVREVAAAIRREPSSKT